MLRAVLSLALALLVTGPMAVFGAPLACACSCAARTTAEYVADADLVVQAEVRSRAQLPATSKEWPQQAEFEMAVTQIHKGETSGLVKVRTADNGASCGLEVTVGQTVLLFATKDGDQWTASLCGGTSALGTERADEALRELGPGRVVTPPPALPTPEVAEPERNWAPAITVAVIALVVVAAGLVLQRRGQARKGRR